jgi:hypothetical protein
LGPRRVATDPAASTSDTAAQVYELLSPFAGLPVMASLAVACFGSTHCASGIAATAMGEPERAVWHLHTAIQHNLAPAHWPAVALCEARHAEAMTLHTGR